MGDYIVNPGRYTGTSEDDTVVFTNDHSGASQVDGGEGYDTLIIDHSNQGASTVQLGWVAGRDGFNGTARVANGYTTSFIYNFEEFDVTGSDFADTHRLGIDDFVSGYAATFDGGAGRDRLTISFARTTTDARFDASGETIVSSFGSFANYERFFIEGGSGNDTFVGGALNDEIEGGDGQNSMYGGDGNDTIFSTSILDYSNGGGGLDTWRVNFRDTAQRVTFEVADAVHVNGMLAAEEFETISIDASYRNDTFIVSALSDITIDGLAGLDTLVADYSSQNEAIVFAISPNSYGQYSGSVTLGVAPTHLTFQNLEMLDLRGGSGDDRFSFSRPVAGAVAIDGGAGWDTLEIDFSQLDAAVTFLVSGDGTVASNVGSYANIDSFIMTGSAHDDLIELGLGNDQLLGGDGNDQLNGGGGDDLISGGIGSDVIHGGNGDDILVGTTGSSPISDVDELYGGYGHDTLYAGLGETLLDGGLGIDTAHYTYLSEQGVTVSLRASGQPQEVAGGIFHTLISIENLDGSSNSDTLMGSGDDNRLNGLSGDDVLFGYGGDDVLLGDQGNDRLSGGTGNNVLDGGWGIDTADYSRADAGIRISLALQGVSQDTGNRANDTLVSIENLMGSDFDDTLTGDAYANRIDGANGADEIFGGGAGDHLTGGFGRDDIFGGDGNDVLSGDFGNDLLVGNFGDDSIYGGRGGDIIAAGVGRDLVDGGDGDDLISGGADDDLLDGGAGYDDIDGGTGNDFLTGGFGWDNLSGGDGDDSLFGGHGRDILDGGSGIDALTGGRGADLFRFSSNTDLHAESALSDTITDFDQTQGDLIDVSGIDADTLTPGNQAFSFIGDAAFSATVGELRYIQSGADTLVEMDTDGDGIADLTLTLNGLTDLTMSDFVL